MKKIASLFTLICLTMCFAIQANAQFEGFIEFTKKVGTITTTYKYFVHGDNIRIEEMDDEGKVLNVMLVDNKQEQILALNPDRKLYMEVPNKRAIPEVNAKVTKTENAKEILGYNCVEYTVKSSDDNRFLSFWIADEDFNFFIPLLKTLNRKDKQAVYFSKLKMEGGVFPLVGTEKNT